MVIYKGTPVSRLDDTPLRGLDDTEEQISVLEDQVVDITQAEPTYIGCYI